MSSSITELPDEFKLYIFVSVRNWGYNRIDLGNLSFSDHK